MAFGLKNTTALVERRRAQRESVNVAVVARLLTGERVPLTVEVLSTGGFLAATPQAIAKGTAVDISFPTGRAVRVQVVWVEDGKIGCKFAATVNLPDLLKSAEGSSPPRFERRGLIGLKREVASDSADQLVFDPPITTDTATPETSVANAEVRSRSAQHGPDANSTARAAEEAAWLDQFGWLPIDTYAAIYKNGDDCLRPVLLRSGSEWAFGRQSGTGWIDMTDSGLGEDLRFDPTLWTPVSDDRAAELSDL